MNIQGMNPLMAAPLQAQATNSNATTGTGSSGTSTGSTSSSSLEGTFLSLLVTELQNQDPTQPVDPTQMVGEMISLNQLDQLIAINQTLSGLNGNTNPSSSSESSRAGSTATAPGSGSNMSSALQSAISNLSPLISHSTAKTILGANGSPSHLTPTASPVASNKALPGYPGTVPTGALTPAAWMNLYGSIGAPANATNQFTATGGR